jgi:hypothetical protein
VNTHCCGAGPFQRGNSHVTGRIRPVYDSGMRVLVVVAALAAVLVPSSSSAVVGEQRLALVLATWGPEPVTVEEARTAVAETDAYIREASFGKTWLAVDIIGWVRALPARPRGCDTRGIHRTISQAVDLSQYEKVAYVLPRIDCGWTGAYYPPGVWMLGEVSKDLFAHELGHTYGVTEEGPAWVCAGGCTAENYGSPYSVMGHGSGHYDAYEKWRFGWIERIGPFVRDGAYGIARIDRASTLPHALYVVSGADEYWIEYRPEVAWPVVHAGPQAASVSASRFPGRNLLLAGARSATFPVRGAFQVTLSGADGEQATLRFRWTDRTPPSRPRLSVVARGRTVFLRFPASDSGSGVDRYELRVDGRPRATVSTVALVAQELIPHEARRVFRLTRGAHRIRVVAVDRAGNAGSGAVRTVRIP